MKSFIKRTLSIILLALVITIAFWGDLSATDVQAASGTWTFTGSMSITREYHTATLLLNGKVLVTGGYSGSTILSSYEIFDPATGVWVTTGLMSTARYGHTATLLPDGKVLVVGGYNGSYTDSAELYDPITDSWSITGSMITARTRQSATLLINGKVLVAGGYNGSYLSSSEIYDPATGLWISSGAMITSKVSHTATLLPNGKVLITGGFNGSIFASAEMFDPATGLFSTVGSMNTARSSHTATLLPDGKVLSAGGYNGTYLNSTELYDPAADTWTFTGAMSTTRRMQAAALLPNGTVLVVGGYNGSVLSSAELYDPLTSTWTTTGAMNSERQYHTGTLLPDGKMLITGGYNLVSYLSSAELYDPSASSWTLNPNNMNTARRGHTATLLPSGKVLAAGGYNGISYLIGAELFDPSDGSWTVTGAMNTSRNQFSATLLPNGKVLVAGGYNGSYLSNSELYDPDAGTWSTTGSMNTPRSNHTASLLPNGKVLVTGGYSGSTYLSSAELYDPDAGTWTTTGGMGFQRAWHTATLLPEGKVLVTGGYGNSTYHSSAEVYDLISGSWSAVDSMNTARELHTATLLLNGKVLVVGGNAGGGNFLSSAELYDPAADSWTYTASMSTNRYYHTATLMPDGTVLVAGGTSNIPTYPTYLSSSQVYDPGLDTWEAHEYFNVARQQHTATMLADSSILVTGGSYTSVTSTALRYNPGLGYLSAWQPTIASVNTLACLGESISVSGTGYRGFGYIEASSSTSQSSPSNYPLVQLRHLDSGQTIWLPAASFTPTSLTTIPIVGINPSPILLTIYVNSIPSISEMITVSSPPVITLSDATYSVNEDGGSVTITAQISGGRSGDVTVDYDTADGSALAGSDYTATSGTLTFIPTDTEKTITVPILDDDLDEGDETFSVTLSNPTIAVLGSPNSAGVTITDDPPPGSWTETGSMTTERRYHTATLLTDGKVLVVGGISSGGDLSSTERYDPATGNWASEDELNIARYGHTATLLPDGKVLVAGGFNGSLSYLDSAELYDPQTGTWTITDSMNTARRGHTAILLLDGKVLVTNGVNSSEILSSTELYDPQTGTWTVTGAMSSARRYQTATLMPDGKVLVVGGQYGSALFSSEIYNPTTGIWTSADVLNFARYGHTATLLPDGKVLVAGGYNLPNYLSSAELYDPQTDTWTVTGSMDTPHYLFSATLLQDGKVLIAGGISGSVYPDSAELYDPQSGSWTLTGTMNTARDSHTATLLPHGKVLVVGGYDGGYLSSAEIYEPSGGSWAESSPPMSTLRMRHTATLLPDGKVLVAGGNNSVTLSSAELYDPISETWTNTGSMVTGRYYHTATLLNNGKVLIAAGYNAVNLTSAELYDPGTGTWVATGSMAGTREQHTATLLEDGRVLVTGGWRPGATALNGVEIFNPVSGTWSTATSMSSTRYSHSATLLPDGLILVVGGNGTGGVKLNTTEVYDPITNSWTGSGSLATARAAHTATLLPNGKVLVIGGSDGTDVLMSAEIYDPDTGTWTVATSMSDPRLLHTATLLPNGNVLVAGGRTTGNVDLNSSEIYNPALDTWSDPQYFNFVREYSPATLLPDGKVLLAGGYDIETSDKYNSTELYDPGLGYESAWQPTITSVNSPLSLGETLTVSGASFRGYGYTEASSGGTQSSPTNFPLVQLRHIDSGQSIWLPVSDFDATDLTTIPLNGIHPGLALLTVYVNSIPSTAQVITITPPPIITLSNATYSVNEDGVSVTITAQINGARSMDVTVDFATADGTAQAGSDYTAASGTLTFTPTDTEKTFTVTILDDAIYEGSETFIVSLSNPTNSSLGDPASATVTITNDDPLPEIVLSNATYSVDEDGVSVTITAQISGARSMDVTVDYATLEDTALPGSDYTATSGTLTLTPTDSEKTFTVTILDDAIYEGDESFIVALSNPTNASLGEPFAASVVIFDDESMPIIFLSSATYSTNEENVSVTITAQISGARSMDVMVNYATADGTALAGSDYTSTSDAITFTPTDTQLTFTVPILDDGIYEGDETFSVSIFDPIFAALGNPASAVVTIIDDDPLPEIVLSNATYSVNEDGASVTITAQISGIRSMDTTVDYATADGSALAGSDYTASNGTLTFIPTDIEKTFIIPILEDTMHEGDETFTIALSNPTHATLGIPSEAVITIMDNDEALADLSITKSGSPDPVIVGHILTYTLTIVNNGPQPAVAVVVTDNLPAEVTFLSATGVDWICNEESGIVTCNTDSMANSYSSLIEIQVLAPMVSGEINNSAAVTSTTADDNLDNNQVTISTFVDFIRVFLPLILK